MKKFKKLLLGKVDLIKKYLRSIVERLLYANFQVIVNLMIVNKLSDGSNAIALIRPKNEKLNGLPGCFVRPGENPLHKLATMMESEGIILPVEECKFASINTYNKPNCVHIVYAIYLESIEYKSNSTEFVPPIMYSWYGFEKEPPQYVQQYVKMAVKDFIKM